MIGLKIFLLIVGAAAVLCLYFNGFGMGERVEKRGWAERGVIIPPEERRELVGGLIFAAGYALTAVFALFLAGSL